MRHQKAAGSFRDWFAAHVGVSPERKGQLFVDFSRSVTLRDATYWIQILFAAGIATLGLVLNSPAVIIGAMLISPLMGPILASGLALATGDVILGIRAIANLALSCLLAVAFAVLLIALLPFKEMTNEIAARTRPTTLDLVVAFFSGAVGSLAACKEVKGVVTSIPGVAIAVALMPPLCVVGYGVGISFSLNPAEGMRIAGGGGLLFLTNLVAITFTAMIVFLALHIDTQQVRTRVEEWRDQDSETTFLRDLMGRFHVPVGLRVIGGLPGRFLLILVPILLILIPLAQSFNQLKQEIASQQNENRVRRTATALWQQYFGELTGGQPRTSIDQLSISPQDGRLTLQFRVFTSKPLTSPEKTEFVRVVATRLNVPSESIGLQLVEIPTASGELAAKAREERHDAPPTIAALGARFVDGVEAALLGLILPPPAKCVGNSVLVSATDQTQVRVTYLSDRDIDVDGQALLAEEVKARLGLPALLSLERIDPSMGRALFGRNQSALTTSSQTMIDGACAILERYPSLRIDIVSSAEKDELEGIAGARAQSIVEYLSSRSRIDAKRISVTSESGDRTATLTLAISEK